MKELGSPVCSYMEVVRPPFTTSGEELALLFHNVVLHH